MKTLVLKASPRKSGNTATLADELIRGLRDAQQTDIVEFSLNDLVIRPCQACNRCFEPPYEGCALDDDFQKIFPVFRESDLIVFAAPVYWWHLCSQMKTFIDRMHPMLTFDRQHGLTTKHLILLTAYFAEDPYGVELVVRMFESITGWAGMGLDVIRYHSAKRHVREDATVLRKAYDLGRGFQGPDRRPLSFRCPLETCGFAFQDVGRLAMHMVMAAGEDHLQWKAEHLSAVHTLSNTHELATEAETYLRRAGESEAPPAA
jgi:multimeric flavodoxin WrbA